MSSGNGASTLFASDGSERVRFQWIPLERVFGGMYLRGCSQQAIEELSWWTLRQSLLILSNLQTCIGELHDQVKT